MGFGISPEFKPERMTSEFVRTEIEKLAARTGILHADRAEWMIEPIIEGDQNGSQPDRMFIKDKRLPETLTEIGRTDPGWALAAIMRCAPRARNRNRERCQAEYLATTDFKRPDRFSAVDDKRTCRAALDMQGRLFETGSEPELPLADCDAWHCRCTYIGHYARRPAT